MLSGNGVDVVEGIVCGCYGNVKGYLLMGYVWNALAPMMITMRGIHSLPWQQCC